MPPKLLIVSHDVVSEHMAGPAVRYWELAKILTSVAEVSLAVPAQSTLSSSDIPLIPYSAERPERLKEAASQADMLLIAGFILHKFPFLVGLDIPIIVDLYGPFILEHLEQLYQTQELSNQMAIHESDVWAVNNLLQRGDFFLCASEKQRDYWLGTLSALGRLNPYTHNDDKTLRRLIDVVPFGLPREKPVHTEQVLKGVYKSIQPDDFVIIWSGDIWEWLDASTLIKALPLVTRKLPQTKLFFMGVKRPNRLARQAVDEAVALSQELGLYDTHIFFNEWVPYDERQNYLLEADLGVSLHLNHVETQFAYRTRFLDNLLTGLPLLATEGDLMGAELARLNLARTVEAQNVAAVAGAIIEMLNQQEEYRRCYQAHFETMVARYQWENIVQPLVQFCVEPYFAPDKTYLQTTPVVEIGPSPYWKLPHKAWRSFRANGAQGLLWQLKKSVLWKQGG